MNTNDDLSFEQLDALLNVTIEPSTRRTKAVECGQTPPRAKPTRHTEWSNLHTFEFGGYVARVQRLICSCCEEQTDVLQGIFLEEVHLPSGTRRMTRMAPKGDWPAQGEHRKEVEVVGTDYCAQCIGDLGFSRLVWAAEQPRTLIKEAVT